MATFFFFYFPQMLVISAASVHPHREAVGLRKVTQVKNQAQSAPVRLRGEVEHTQMCMWVWGRDHTAE